MKAQSHQPDLHHLVTLLLVQLTAGQREVIVRRFGLYMPQMRMPVLSRELGMSRQNADQLANCARKELYAFAAHNPQLCAFQLRITSVLQATGGTMRTDTLVQTLNLPGSSAEQARIAFVAWTIPGVTEIPGNSRRYGTVTLWKRGNLNRCITQLVTAARFLGEPVPFALLARSAHLEDLRGAEAVARTSKQLGELNGQWGLAVGGTIQLGLIRNRIIQVLLTAGRPMHFAEIAQAIREDAPAYKGGVTDGSVRNELMSDQRFIRTGQGIYALREWGYVDGSLRDAIVAVLREATGPLDAKTLVERVQARWASERGSIMSTLRRLASNMPQIERTERGEYRWRK